MFKKNCICVTALFLLATLCNIHGMERSRKYYAKKDTCSFFTNKGKPRKRQKYPINRYSRIVQKTLPKKNGIPLEILFSNSRSITPNKNTSKKFSYLEEKHKLEAIVFNCLKTIACNGDTAKSLGDLTF